VTDSQNGHGARNGGRSTRIAAVGDLHCTVDSRGRLHDLFAQASAEADVIALCGDLTDYGLPDEAHVLAGELSGARVPVVGVLGNHDHESGKQVEVAQILTEAGMKVLDGDAVQLAGVGFAGTKGFAGGFDIHSLGAWGEVATKAFVQAAVDEAMKLEAGLARLRTRTRVALLHYSPVSATVRGEPEQIYPFLGSSRLEEPIERLEVSAVFHGHAHHGVREGATRRGVPVYNVSMPLLLAAGLGAKAYRVVELPSQPDTEPRSPAEHELTPVRARQATQH
jgi:Icc-related predicted phosphoesterase